MILQVNKKKKKEQPKVSPDGINFSIAEEFENAIKEGYSKVTSSQNYERRSGKSTTMKHLSELHNLPLLSNLNSKTNFSKAISKADRDIVLVDELDAYTLEKLRNYGMKTIGIAVFAAESIKKEAVYEDYIEISSIQQKHDIVVARAKNGEMIINRDKTFRDNYDDNYNSENVDYVIDSIYLLDDTGKTIKKII